jgi:hypothetical protein
MEHEPCYSDLSFGQPVFTKPSEMVLNLNINLPARVGEVPKFPVLSASYSSPRTCSAPTQGMRAGGVPASHLKALDTTLDTTAARLAFPQQARKICNDHLGDRGNSIPFVGKRCGDSARINIDRCLNFLVQLRILVQR